MPTRFSAARREILVEASIYHLSSNILLCFSRATTASACILRIQYVVLVPKGLWQSLLFDDWAVHFFEYNLEFKPTTPTVQVK